MNTIRLSKEIHTAKDISALASKVMSGHDITLQTADQAIGISLFSEYKEVARNNASGIAARLEAGESIDTFIKLETLKLVTRKLKDIFDNYFSDEVSFTDVEREIIKHIVEDAADNFNISEIMGITESAVKVNLRRIMLKLGIKNRTQLVVKHYRGQINEKNS